MSPVSGNQRWRRLVLFAVAGASLSLVLSALLYLQSSRSIDRANDAAVQAKAASDRANEAIDGIQRSRIDLTYRGCADQNERNEKLLTFLHGLPPRPGQPRSPEGLLRGFTDALAGPHQDCEELILRRFGREGLKQIRRARRPHKP